MSHAHTPMHAWGGGRQAHYAPSRNVVRGVTPMRRRGYALCVYGRNTMRDVTQLGVNGRDWAQHGRMRVCVYGRVEGLKTPRGRVWAHLGTPGRIHGCIRGCMRGKSFTFGISESRNSLIFRQLASREKKRVRPRIGGNAIYIVEPKN